MAPPREDIYAAPGGRGMLAAAAAAAGGGRFVVPRISFICFHWASAPASDSIAVLHEDDKGDLLLLAHQKCMTEMRGWLILLATLAATLTYRSGLNPPGGFWQDDKAGPGGHVAGQPVLRYKSEYSYGYFKEFNAMAFLTSVLISVLVSSERFYRTRARMTALLLITLFDLACLVAAYMFGTSPGDPIGGSLYLIGAVIVCVLIFSVVYTRKAIGKLMRFLHHLAKLWWCPDEATK